MAGCCGPKCSKAFVIFFNIHFWFSGCALVALGVVLLYDQMYSYVFTMLTADTIPPVVLQYIAFGCIGLGGIILFVGFFGCCGALQDSKCMLGTYVFFLILVFLVEVGAALIGVYGWLYFPIEVRPTLKQKLNDEYGVQFQNQNQNQNQFQNRNQNQNYGIQDVQGQGMMPTSEQFKNALDFVQYDFECCGIDGKQDWEHSKWVNKTIAETRNKVKVPPTCCAVNKDLWQESDEPWKTPKAKDEMRCQAMDRIDYEGYVHQVGCWDQLEKWYYMQNLCLTPTLGGLAFLQIIGVVFSICLIRNIGEEV